MKAILLGGPRDGELIKVDRLDIPMTLSIIDFSKDYPFSEKEMNESDPEALPVYTYRLINLRLPAPTRTIFYLYDGTE